MAQFEGVWALVSLSAEGGADEASREVLTASHRLAERLGKPLTAVLLTEPEEADSQTAHLAGLGVDRVLVVHANGIHDASDETRAAILSDLMDSHKPDILLTAASAETADFAPRLAIRTGGGLVTQAIDLDIDAEGMVIATRSCYAESLLSQVTVQARPQLITLKRKAFPPATREEGRPAPAVETVDVELGRFPSKLKRLEIRPVEEQGAQKLEEADIVVSGGRGLKGPEHFHFVEELAAAVGGAVGASRAVVDAGWRPHAEQVGQTGKTVTPKVYIALGISGAIQHLVGMSGSQLIIAINRDENAPIFKTADFGIVGDVSEIVPELIRLIKEKNLVLHV